MVFTNKPPSEIIPVIGALLFIIFLASKPGMFDFKGKAKWEAWNKRKGKSQDDAKAEYVACVEKICGKKF